MQFGENRLLATLVIYFGLPVVLQIVSLLAILLTGVILSLTGFFEMLAVLPPATIFAGFFGDSYHCALLWGCGMLCCNQSCFGKTIEPYLKRGEAKVETRRYVCPKCGCTSYESDQFQATGGNFAKLFDIQNKSFIRLVV